MRKRIIYLMIPALIILAGLIAYARLGKAIGVKAQKVKQQELLVTVTSTSTGRVKADNEVRVTAERAGRVNVLYFEEGDVVKKGELLAELDYEEILLNRKRIEAVLGARKRQAAELRALLDSLRVEVESRIKESEAVLEEARQLYGSYRKLLKKGYVSKVKHDEVKKQYEIALASYETALSGRKKIEAKEEGLNLQKARIREVEAELELLNLEYKRSFIKSSIDGVVTSRPVKPGDTLMKGSVLATVVNTESLYIEAPIDEADIARVRVGQDVRVIMDAYPDDLFLGAVESISPLVLGKRLEARTFKVKVLLKDEPPTFKPGMSADVEIIVGRVKDSLVVPTQSIVERRGKRLVYLIDGNRARLTEVKTGLFNWNFTEVKEGLSEGDIIVINPDVPGLKDGIKVTVVDESY